ncbi:MAG: hypothetical protein JWM19_7867 [Actinomycetia bacterium]|nr:hypothetical protein [Actinomycetes bacterium]
MRQKGRQGCQLHGCRAEWNGGPGGFYISGPASGLALTGCSTDRNREHGLYIDASGNAPVLISGFMAHRDGASGTSDGYAGVTLNGASCPVLIDGLVASLMPCCTASRRACSTIRDTAA